jgi:hypothetical protein
MFDEVSVEALRHVVGGSARSQRLVTLASMQMQGALAALTASFASRNNAMQQMLTMLSLMQGGSPAAAAAPPGYQLAGYTANDQPEYTPQTAQPQDASASSPSTATA